MRLVQILLAMLALAVAAQAAEEHLGRTVTEWREQLNATERLDRLLAARAVGELALGNATGSQQALTAAMANDDSAVRYWAVVAAAWMGDRARPFEQRLAGLAKGDPAPEVRIWAAHSLVRLGRGQEGLAVLIAELANEEKGARLQAAHALDELGIDAKPAAAALQETVDDEFDYVQRIARHALFVIGERPCPYRECSPQ